MAKLLNGAKSLTSNAFTRDFVIGDIGPIVSPFRQPDPYAKDAIEQLTERFSQPIWPNPDSPTTAPPPPAPAAKTKGTKAKTAKISTKSAAAVPYNWKEELEGMLKTNLVGLDLSKFESRDPNPITLEELLAKDDKTTLLGEVENRLEQEKLRFNTETVLNHPTLLHYLFADAVYERGYTNLDAIVRYIMQEKRNGGMRRIYERVVDESVTRYIEDEHIDVGTLKDFQDAVRPELFEGNYSFLKDVFRKEFTKPIDSYTNDRDEIAIIREQSNNLKLRITPVEEEKILQYFDQSPVGLLELAPAARGPILIHALSEIRNATFNVLAEDSSPITSSDFSVSYHTESSDSLVINQSNVLCAAQLFYVKTLGDELGVFDAADLLVTDYLSRSVVDIRSQQLLQDLQNYVLNEEFPALQNGRMHKRTSPEERRMFYRQVFNSGDSTLMEGMVTNSGFEMLWNVLMIETVKYIEKVERSERPESYVSRRPVAQAIEDLQYNLSTHSSGMAKIMTPVAYRELDFLIERVFSHPEIVSQLALHNSQSYWKVIERILQDRYREGINITAMQKKAEFGHRILAAVGNYSRPMINDDQKFTNFVSLVEAFIITSEQLESHSDNGLFDSQDMVPAANGNGEMPVSDIWDF